MFLMFVREALNRCIPDIKTNRSSEILDPARTQDVNVNDVVSGSVNMAKLVKYQQVTMKA